MLSNHRDDIPNLSDAEALSFLYQIAGVGLIVWNLKQESLSISPNIWDLFGFRADPEEYHDVNFWQGIIHVDDWTNVNQAISDIKLRKTLSKEIVFRIKKSEDDFLWILARVHNVEYNQNTTFKIVASLIEVDRLNSDHVEAKLHWDRYRNLINSSPIGVFVTLRENPKTIIYTNDTLAEILGVDDIENEDSKILEKRYILRDHDFTQFILETDKKRMLALLNDKYLNDTSVKELKMITQDSKILDVEVKIIVSDWEEKEAIYFFIQDVTQRKLERDQLAMANEDLERFTYSVSHDLKTPLTTIRSFLGELQKESRERNSELFIEDLNRITRAAGRLEKLVAGLLELSRIGRFHTEKETVSLENVVSKQLESLSEMVKNSNAAIIVGKLPTIKAVRVRMHQLMQNLIQNAVKFMGDEKKPTVEIGSIKKNDMYIVFVRDNGIGIEDNHKERIFEVFSRLNPKIDGTGVGLAEAKRIVETHDANLWVEESPPRSWNPKGKGSTFCISFPESSIINWR